MTAWVESTIVAATAMVEKNFMFAVGGFWVWLEDCCFKIVLCCSVAIVVADEVWFERSRLRPYIHL